MTEVELSPRPPCQQRQAHLHVVPEFVTPQLQDALSPVKLTALHSARKRMDELLALVARQPGCVTGGVEVPVVVGHRHTFLVRIHINRLDDLDLIKVVEVDHRIAFPRW